MPASSGFPTTVRLLFLAITLAAPGCAPSPGGTPAPRSGGSLPAFRDAAELEAYHAALVEEILSQPVLGPPPAIVPPPPPPPRLPVDQRRVRDRRLH
ncbi:MAG TPA: hypothetical protein VHG91_10120, partial [Longimicrobium sp.]|nr:hypothetical protein [Longimicrobium sp.]